VELPVVDIAPELTLPVTVRAPRVPTLVKLEVTIEEFNVVPVILAAVRSAMFAFKATLDVVA